MEKEDHLSNEISVSAELTEAGGKASIKSRFVSAMDRLCGGIVDFGNAYLESSSAKKRAKTEGEVALIKRAAQFGLQKIEHDSVFAERAFENHYQKVLKAQSNKEAVVKCALEDLKNNATSKHDEDAGPQQLNDEFLDRFERYAEDASTEQLRERWGRILAGEVRKPGTFNRKVLRAIDELDTDTASLFEQLAACGVDDAIFVSILGELTFNQLVRLSSSGLIVNVDQQIRFFTKLSNGVSEDIWMLRVGEFGLGIPVSSQPVYDDNKVLCFFEEKPCIPFHLLTDVGTALMTIIPVDERDVIRRVAHSIEQKLGGSTIGKFSLDREKSSYSPIDDF
ncbi:DUF2806 domain-containing protein [Brucella anthropi]|uniref:DUF2806 domain-containing protein n=1 Tax=Brucella anthropi TaxID=529 RepID=UPI00124F6A03|nr:DUF2806 domain-containing protein [Brucella anthropi]KAB2792870.1 DUF2806 domain-containing protein [Brucella anthropi]